MDPKHVLERGPWGAHVSSVPLRQHRSCRLRYRAGADPHGALQAKPSGGWRQGEQSRRCRRALRRSMARALPATSSAGWRSMRARGLRGTGCFLRGRSMATKSSSAWVGKIPRRSRSPSREPTILRRARARASLEAHPEVLVRCHLLAELANGRTRRPSHGARAQARAAGSKDQLARMVSEK